MGRKQIPGIKKPGDEKRDIAYLRSYKIAGQETSSPSDPAVCPCDKPRRGSHRRLRWMGRKRRTLWPIRLHGLFQFARHGDLLWLTAHRGKSYPVGEVRETL